MTTGFAELRQEMTQLRQDVRQEIMQLRQEIHEAQATRQRQLWVILGAVIVALLKIAFFP